LPARRAHLRRDRERALPARSGDKALDVARYFAYTVTCREIGYGKDEPAFFSRVCGADRREARRDGAVRTTRCIPAVGKGGGHDHLRRVGPERRADEEAIRATADHYLTRLDEATAFSRAPCKKRHHSGYRWKKAGGR
jgi:hypothetical protein